MRVLTEFSDPAARAIAKALPGRMLRGLMETPGYENRHVILFVDDERLRFEPDGLGPVGYNDPGPFDAAHLHPEPGRGRGVLFDRQGRLVTRIEGVIAEARLLLDLTKERDDYGPDGPGREHPMVTKIVFELTLVDTRVYEISSDGEEVHYQQTAGFEVERPR